MPPRNVVIIGGGHNALACAFYLARAGHKPLVLERRAMVGGAAVTEEFAPGFRCSTLAHCSGPLRAEIARDMQLARHGLQMISTEPALTALTPDGRGLALYADAARSAEEIAKFSKRDAAQYPEFQQTLAKLSAVLARVMRMTPPPLDRRPPFGELLKLHRTAHKIKNLRKRDMFRLLRWGPMAVADLVAEWFESEPLRAMIAARGIFGAALGPWSAGSGALLLLRAAADAHPAGSTIFPRGGMGALTEAMAAAAKQAGAEIRCDSEVTCVRTRNGLATGVVLTGGEEIAARAVVSGADPKRTLLSLLDPVELEPDFAVKLGNYRCTGISAKVNLALEGLPRFKAFGENDDPRLLGRIQIGHEIDYLERAFDHSKYGGFSERPYLDILIPSLRDPTLAPEGKHLMSIYMQFAPYKLRAGDWNARREALGDAVVKTLAEYAPDLPRRILHRQVITPADLEREYSLTGGQIFHGEPALDQLFTMRPLLGWARYQTPVRNLFLCGAGTHPGIGVTGGSGANAAREIVKTLR